MQATTIHNFKKSKGLDPDKEVFSFGTGKGAMLQVTYSLLLSDKVVSIT
jgi:hypothetical protein